MARGKAPDSVLGSVEDSHPLGIRHSGGCVTHTDEWVTLAGADSAGKRAKEFCSHRGRWLVTLLEHKGGGRVCLGREDLGCELSSLKGGNLRSSPIWKSDLS